MDKKKLGAVTLAVVAISAIAIVSIPTPPDGVTTTIEDPTIIDELFANVAQFLVWAEDDDGYLLSDMTTVGGNNSYEQIGNVSNTKNANDDGYGFRIHWNGTIYHTPLTMCIVLTFPVGAYANENLYDYNITFVVTISHNVTIEYNFGVIVSQLIFYSEPVTWNFERIGTISEMGRFTFDTTVLDNSSYRCVRDEGKGNIITPMLSITCPIESDFRTEMIIHHARIDVITQK